jgi:hypothetical protein
LSIFYKPWVINTFLNLCKQRYPITL